MENTTNRNGQLRPHIYQKDYSKLEEIFEKAVERSRREKIIHYASDRLYTADDRKMMARESFKTVSGAEPLLEHDIQTEIVDLEKPSPPQSDSLLEDKQLMDFFSSATNSEETLTSTDALRAYEALVDVSDEELKEEPIVFEDTSFSELVTEELEPEASEETDSEMRVRELRDLLANLDTKQRAEETETQINYSETIREEPEVFDIGFGTNPTPDPEPVFKTAEPETQDPEPQSEEPEPYVDFDTIVERVTEPEPPEPTEPAQKTESTATVNLKRAHEFFEEDFEDEEAPEVSQAEDADIEDVRKDVTTSQFVLIACAIFLGIYVVVFFPSFSGYDYIALVLTVLGIFLAFYLDARALIASCAVMMVVLVSCMIYTIIRTSEGIVFYHYLWFLFIPILMSTTYAFVNSKKKLSQLQEEKTTEQDYDNNEPLKETTEELLREIRERTGEIPEAEVKARLEKEPAPEPKEEQPELESAQPEREPLVTEESAETNVKKDTIPVMVLDFPSGETEVVTEEETPDELPESFSMSFEQIHEDIDYFEALPEEEEEVEATKTFELSDTYHNSFDWSHVLDETERENNTSVIDEMGEDTLLSDFVENATRFDDIDPENEADASRLADILAMLEGEDEETISVSDENIDMIWNLTDK